MEPKKILIVNAAGAVGGDVAMFLLGLPFFDRRRYLFRVVSIPRGTVYEKLRAMENTSVSTMELGGKELSPSGRWARLQRGLAFLLAIVRISALVRRERIDVIYALDRTIATTICYLVALLSGRPLVLSAHISHYLSSNQLMRMIVRHAARVTVTSNNMYGQFRPYVRDESRLVTILNAINIGPYDMAISGDQVRADLQIGPTTPIVALAGRLSPFKGQPELIRAAAIVRRQHPDIQFLLVGSDHGDGYQATLERLIAAEQLGGVVRLLGFRNDLPAVFAAATICAMPSHEEPFGLVALEAMAMAKPVVATRAGGVPEFLVDGQMGILIEPRDVEGLARAILRLLDNPQLAREMGQRGRQQVEQHFSAPVYGAKIVAALDAVIAESRATPGKPAEQAR
jgi:glycosyltransferase involved in cell wall biosynthesis